MGAASSKRAPVGVSVWWLLLWQLSDKVSRGLVLDDDAPGFDMRFHPHGESSCVVCEGKPHAPRNVWLWGVASAPPVSLA